MADGFSSQWQVYHDEHPIFKAAAHRRGLGEGFWDELDRLLAAPPAEAAAQNIPAG